MKRICLTLFIILLLIPFNINAETNESEDYIWAFNDTNTETSSEESQESTQIEEDEDDYRTPGHWEDTKENIHFCQREDTSRAVRITYSLFRIIRIIVPILLIFSLMIGFMKTVLYQEEVPIVKKTVVTKCVAAILIFLAPNILSISTKILNFEVNYDDCLEMSKNPKKVKVWVKDELQVFQQGVYIKTGAKYVKGYYFSDKDEKISMYSDLWIPSNKNIIDFVLLPGNHYIYVKTKNGILKKNIEIKASDIIVTNDVNDISILTTSLDEFLLDQGSSLSEFNEAIARSVYIAGGSTKEGAAAAALALTQLLYVKYNVKIPYGNTHGNHIVMGAHGAWGSPNVYGRERDGKFYNQGMHCGGFVAWAYAQANFDMNPGIGSSAQFCEWRYGDLYDITSSNKGSVGDVITYATQCDSSSHVAIITAMDEHGYYVTEANAITTTIDGLRTLGYNIGIVTTYNPYGSRWRSFIDMSLTIRSRKKDSVLSSGF